jgi:hypothetical protein
VINRRRLLFALGIATALLVLVPLEVLARGGGGGHGGGAGGHGGGFGGGGFGGGGGSYGSSYGGGGFGGGFPWWLFFLGGGGGSIFFFLFIILALYSAYRRLNLGTPMTAVNDGPAWSPVNAMTHSVVDDEAALKEKDPNFNESVFMDRVQTTFFALQKGWMERNLEPVRVYMSDGLYHRWKIQVDAMIAAD